MINVFYGKKGMGKTKALLDKANEFVAKTSGNVVFIDDSSQLMCDLKHEIRFINVSEYPIDNDLAFIGFLCGVISENYDIDSIFIDRLTYILKQDIQDLGRFFECLKKISSQFNIKFYISINGDPDTMPDYIKEFVE